MKLIKWDRGDKILISLLIAIPLILIFGGFVTQGLMSLKFEMPEVNLDLSSLTKKDPCQIEYNECYRESREFESPEYRDILLVQCKSKLKYCQTLKIECIRNDNCPDSMPCVSQSGRCFDPNQIECYYNSHCPDGQTCDRETGQCD